MVANPFTPRPQQLRHSSNAMSHFARWLQRPAHLLPSKPTHPSRCNHSRSSFTSPRPSACLPSSSSRRSRASKTFASSIHGCGAAAAACCWHSAWQCNLRNPTSADFVKTQQLAVVRRSRLQPATPLGQLHFRTSYLQQSDLLINFKSNRNPFARYGHKITPAAPRLARRQ